MENTIELGSKEEQLQKEVRTKTELWRTKEQRRHLKRQLSLTDRLMSVLEDALADDREMYRYVQCVKTGVGSETVCEERQAVNEERLGKIVKALSELISIQHDILAVPLFKESADTENTKTKLSSDRDISLRKIELELMKIDGGECREIPQQLLAALSGDEDDP